MQIALFAKHGAIPRLLWHLLSPGDYSTEVADEDLVTGRLASLQVAVLDSEHVGRAGEHGVRADGRGGQVNGCGRQ